MVLTRRLDRKEMPLEEPRVEEGGGSLAGEGERVQTAGGVDSALLRGVPEEEWEKEKSLLGMYPEPRAEAVGTRPPQSNLRLSLPPRPHTSLLLLGARALGAISFVNVLVLLALLFARLLLGTPHCVPAPARQPRQARAPLAQAQNFRRNKGYVEQMQRVAERNIYRRSVKLSRRIHDNNDILLPTVPCPQKVRLGGPRPGTYYWLCIPQHQFPMHWPMAYAVGRPSDFEFEEDLYFRFGINSTVFDPSLPIGAHPSPSSSLPFVTESGGPEAEPFLASALQQTSSSLFKSFSAGINFYGGTPVLKISCHGCDILFAVPVFKQHTLSFPGSYPPVGQIVINLDRWAAPFDSSSREVIKTLEKAGYHMFHSDQIFDSYQNKSYTASFIHKSLLFPSLLRSGDHSWKVHQSSLDMPDET